MLIAMNSRIVAGDGKLDCDVREAVAARGVDDERPRVGRKKKRTGRVGARRDHRESVARVDAASEVRAVKGTRQRLGIATCRATCAYERLGDNAAEHVQRPRSEAARVEARALEPGATHRARDREHRRLGRPLIENVRADLDTREVAVVSNTQIASNTELAKRTLGTFDLLESLDRDRGAVWEARRQARRRWLRPRGNS